MSIIIHPSNGQVTTSSGTASANIIVTTSMLNHIFIKAATSTTTFDYKLTEVFGQDTLLRENVTGEANELIDFPVYRNLTLTIFNASADEIFNYILVFRES